MILVVAVLMLVTSGTVSVNAVSSSSDQGSLTVNGLDTSVTDQEGEQVTFYRIATVTYNGNNPNLAKDWTFSNNDVKTKVLALLEQAAGDRDYEQFINEMAQGIKSEAITPLETKAFNDSDHDGTVVWNRITHTATQDDIDAGYNGNIGDVIVDQAGPVPGIYIAMVTAAEGAKIYNPALLTVLYDSDNLQNGVVDLASNYGNSATLKSSNPGSDKAIKGNNNDDQNRVVYDDTKPVAKPDDIKDEYDEDADWETTKTDNSEGAKTVSVGDKVDYEAEISIPEYPKNAKDQTIWFKDVMEKGLTFDSQYFTMKLKGTNYSVDVDIAATPDANGDRELSVTKTGEFYEESPTADPAYYEGTDGNYYQANATLPTGVTIDTENGTKFEKLTSKKFTFGKIKFNEGSPNGGFVAVVTEYNTLRELLALDSKNPADIKFRLDYSAILNEKAVVGVAGNKNKITYVYSNEPSEGTTHKTTGEAENRKREEDEEIVYTYEVSILKTDSAVENPFKTVESYVEKTVEEGADVTGLYEFNDPDYVETENTTAVAGTTYYEKVTSQVIKTEAELRTEYNIPTGTQVFLPGAEFDVYDAPKNSGGKLIAHVVSNANGIATLSDVAAGTYYFYETKAPAGGYSFDPNTPVAVATANWTTCTWTNSYKDEEIRYTSEKDESFDPANATRVGWIKGGKFYEDTAFPGYTLDETDPENPKVLDASGNEVADVLPAYIKSHTTSAQSTTTTITNPQQAGSGVVVYQVKNSKNPTLPSTGGIGTYMFTVAGVAILALAAFMLIFRRKEDSQH